MTAEARALRAAQTIVIRADGSRAIGSGHVRRMGVLADKLRARGVRVDLLCNPEALSVYPALTGHFDEVMAVEGEAAARAACIAAHPGGVGCVLFDHYGLGAADQRPYRALTPRIAAIDDLADRPHDVDLLFDMNLGRRAADYDGLTPAGAVLHVGPDWQIIRSEFFDRRPAALARRAAARGEARTIFVSMGGVDAGGFTGIAIREALAVAPDAMLDVVVGSGSATLEDLRALAAAEPARIRLHVDARDVAALMSAADVAIGAGGTMTWERNCLGLPAVVLILADNQMLVGMEMRRLGAAEVIDVRSGYEAGAIGTALEGLVAAPARVVAMSEAAAALGGSDGASRIADVLVAALSAA